MKKNIILALIAGIAMSATAQDYNYITIQHGNRLISYPIDEVGKVYFTEDDQTMDYELRVLTFEDADYTADANMVGQKNWSSLIDTPQYGGPLLYPTNNELYRWNDEGNTFLASEFCNTWGNYQFWGNGLAISNYADTDLANGDYNHQLAVYGTGGHNGSKNFCIHNGYADGVYYLEDNLPYLYFYDGEARVIDHMYVNITTYLLNAVTNGNGLTKPIGEEGTVRLVAIGYDADGNEVATRLYFDMATPNGIVSDWTKWDLSGLGEVLMVRFNVVGTNDNGSGFSQPAYFAFDDVAVRFKL